jgi:hypothetical protein
MSLSGLRINLIEEQEGGELNLSVGQVQQILLPV